MRPSLPSVPPQPDYHAAIRSWFEHSPWYRRVTARLGLQGKLIVCFMVLLTIAMGASYWLFIRETRETMRHATSERAINLAQTMAMAAINPLEKADVRELTRISKDFVKNDDVVGASFCDTTGKAIAAASQDPDFQIHDLGTSLHLRPQELMQPQRETSKVLGNIVTVTAPVLRFEKPAIISTSSEVTRLVGYVTVALSTQDAEAALHRVYIILVMVGCFVVLLTFPAIYVIVHRIFSPIRQLVDATHRIANGDLDAGVAIERPDLIGTLARSFNQMAQRIKQHQHDLAAANRDLEVKVTQRTAQLETANKRLSSEIAEKEDFLRAVSHDLNAPLRNISGMATMLLMKSRDKFDDEVTHRLERIQKNVEAETDLIAELLELSRIKTRRQKMELVDVGELVQDLADVFENDFKSKSISFIVDAELPVVAGERARLRQIFQNLIDNAIKYMGDGPIKEIHVGCQIRMTEAEFYVRDTGIGIDAEDISKVFFVFRRGKNTTARNVPGKGVGLASVKSIVETYSGTIWVESEPGRGSTFRFTLNGKHVPQASELEPALEAQPQPAAA